MDNLTTIVKESQEGRLIVVTIQHLIANRAWNVPCCHLPLRDR